MAPFTISINGPDNIGKTFQIALLPDCLTLSKVGSLHETDDGIGQLVQQGRLRDWWWESPPDEFVRTLLGAVGRRYQSAVAEATEARKEFIVFDRGASMFEAVAAAMIAVKRGDNDLDASRSALRDICQKHGLVMPRENCAVLLRHSSDDVETCVERTMAREEDPHDKRYAQYQRLLQTELHLQDSRGAYQHVIRVGETDSYTTLQDTLRGVLFSESRNPLFRPVLHSVQAMFGFAGMSESGKSTLALELCSSLGAGQAFRAKIGYFNDLVSRRLGRSIYTLSDKEQALHFFHELENFARAHYWLRVITVESLHRGQVTRLLKSWLGDKFQIVFVDVDKVRRLERSLVAPDELEHNDEIKLERGIELIPGAADLVLDNNGSVSDSIETLLGYAADFLSRQP